MTGLNSVPSARMDDTGTARVGIGTGDPYTHAFLGMQIAKPLYINLRQSMLVSSIGQKPKMVYPGMDIKLRLAEESRYRPEIAFGMNSVLGHKRFSSEYFALSKRYYNFDFTAGMAWGRLAGAGHFKNPLARLSSGFKQDRDYNSEDAASPSDWFSGEEVGFFGGVEYRTPIDGLSLKADFNGDAYEGEKTTFDYKSPSPWGIGFNYSPREWVSIGASVIGMDKVMARLTFQTNLFNGKGRSKRGSKAYETDQGDSEVAASNAIGGRTVDMGKTRVNGHDFSGILYLHDDEPSALQIGRAARHLLANAAPDIETVTVNPVSQGLRGKSVTFARRSLEQSVTRDLGSPEEVWQDANFTDDRRSIERTGTAHNFKLAPELSLSLGEEETTHLYRTSLVAEERKTWKYGFTSGSSVRFNIADNLHRLSKFRDLNAKSVRSDVDYFTMNRINLDRSFLTYMRTPLPDFHLAATAGYLEEMYAGYGGEALYRPFKSPFAIGAEAWRVYKRDPSTPLALGLWGDPALTGSLNLYYEVPDTDLTTFAKIGRFIGGDTGISTGAQMHLGSGIKVKGFVTLSNAEEKDVFGGSRNVYAGLQMILPFGHMRFVPKGSEARLKAEPMGRDDGALLDKPYDLYDVTEPTSYRHLGRNWQEVLN